MPFFERLVGRFYDGIATDPVVRPLYPEEDLAGARHRLTLFLAQYWGGPRTLRPRARPSAPPDASLPVRHRPGATRPLAVPHARGDRRVCPAARRRRGARALLRERRRSDAEPVTAARLTRDGLATEADVTPERVDDLVRAGVLQPKPDGSFDTCRRRAREDRRCLRGGRYRARPHRAGDRAPLDDVRADRGPLPGRRPHVQSERRRVPRVARGSRPPARTAAGGIRTSEPG